MELLAVYIHKHFLFEKPEFLNFGGQFTIDFELRKNGLYISKSDNPKHIKKIYGENILNVSAIVGNNGVGKTSIMRLMNQEPEQDIVSVYLSDNNIVIRNQSDINLKVQFDHIEYSDENELYPLYYSNHIDYNLRLLDSPINQSSLFKGTIDDYYYENILRQLFFLNSKGQYLKNTFKELPYYEYLVINVNNIEKTKFFDNVFYKNASAGKAIKKELKMLWNYYVITNEPNIHADYNFIANFEVFVLSLLVSDDMSVETNSNRSNISFRDVLNQDSFQAKIEMFLKKRLGNIDGPLYQSLESSVGVELNNSDELIEKIKVYSISKIADGFDLSMMKNHAVNTIKRYVAVSKLYEFISNNADKTFIYEKPNEIKIFVNQDSTKNFLETFISLYQDVQESIDYIQFEYRIFNISPEKKLSTGEQSLLNFFSTIYSFVRKRENHLRKYNQYLLLLDEPETGYHAVWKKKFIKSITEILPELFNELNQNPKVQIIFTTHDALTLSDIPNENITYLKKLEDSSIKVFRIGDDDRPKRSFAANITDLLADSFFVENGLVGDFAKEKIKEVLDNLNYEILTIEFNELRKNPTDANSSSSISKFNDLRKLDRQFVTREKQYIKSVIDIIDEPILRFKLDEMFFQAFPEEIDKDDAIRRAKRILGNAGLNIDDLNQEER